MLSKVFLEDFDIVEVPENGKAWGKCQHHRQEEQRVQPSEHQPFERIRKHGQQEKSEEGRNTEKSFLTCQTVSDFALNES